MGTNDLFIPSDDQFYNECCKIRCEDCKLSAKCKYWLEAQQYSESITTSR